MAKEIPMPGTCLAKEKRGGLFLNRNSQKLIFEKFTV